jgi:hypothetical protein
MVILRIEVMNDMSLSSLYQRLTGAQPAQCIDADDLVAVVAGDKTLDAARRDAVVATLAQSSAHAGLARMLRALEPASQALAADMGERRVASHRTHHRDVGAAHRAHVRRLRWSGALAASLVVAVGVWNWHQGETHPLDTAANLPHAAAVTDRIFTSNDRIFADNRPRARSGESDRVFSSNFAHPEG